MLGPQHVAGRVAAHLLSSRGLSQVDLHGLHVEEALGRLEHQLLCLGGLAADHPEGLTLRVIVGAARPRGRELCAAFSAAADRLIAALPLVLLAREFTTDVPDRPSTMLPCTAWLREAVVWRRNMSVSRRLAQQIALEQMSRRAMLHMLRRARAAQQRRPAAAAAVRGAPADGRRPAVCAGAGQPRQHRSATREPHDGCGRMTSKA